MGNFIVKEVTWMFEEQERLYKLAYNKIHTIDGDDDKKVVVDKKLFNIPLICNYLTKLNELHNSQEYFDQINCILVVFKKHNSILLEYLRKVWVNLDKDNRMELINKLSELNNRLIDCIRYLFPQNTKDILDKIVGNIRNFTIGYCKHEIKRDFLEFSIDKIPKYCVTCEYSN